MTDPAHLIWQPSLLGGGDGDDIGVDRGFHGLERRELAAGAWIDQAPGWVSGADALFEHLLEQVPWRQKQRWMYERKVDEPRLVVSYDLTADDPPHPVLREVADALGERYDTAFVQMGCNLYRDGADSVAWHGDRVARDLPQAVIAIVSLGQPRPFKLRPKGGGRSLALLPGRGDLLVMGGSCQRTWDHCVPKVASAGPRISVQLRHAYA